MLKCSNCNNSVKCYEYFINNEHFVIIMELCNKNLLQFLTEKFMREKMGFEIDDLLIIMKQLNNAFKVMVENKIIHRDLKLENILIKDNNQKILLH